MRHAVDFENERDTAEMHLCAKCCGAKEFSQWVEDNGKVGECDFDKSHGAHHKVVTVEDFAAFVDEYFRDAYQHGSQSPYITEDSDTVSYEQLGDSLEDILGNDLGCDEPLLTAIRENLPDDCDPSSGEEPFYSDWASYESSAAVREREHREEMERFYDEAEMEAALSNKNPLENLKRKLEQLRALLDEKEHFPPPLQKFQLMMVFSFCITSLETYLSDTFFGRVMSIDSCKKKFLQSCVMKDIKPSLHDVHSKGIDSFIKKEILDISFHNLAKVKPLYKDVLGVDTGDIGSLSKLINKRHDFVHRGGKDVDGRKVVTSRKEVLEMIEEISSKCTAIEAALLAMA